MPDMRMVDPRLVNEIHVLKDGHAFSELRVQENSAFLNIIEGHHLGRGIPGRHLPDSSEQPTGSLMRRPRYPIRPLGLANGLEFICAVRPITLPALQENGLLYLMSASVPPQVR